MTPMPRDAVFILLSGNTVTLKRTDGLEAGVYYGADGTAYMAHPEHGVLTGPWAAAEGGYAVTWNKGVGEMSWTLAHAPGEIAYLDSTGTQRATLLRMERGDVSGLALR